MDLYEGVAYQGIFRDYQQRIPENTKQYIAEEKI